MKTQETQNVIDINKLSYSFCSRWMIFMIIKQFYIVTQEIQNTNGRNRLHSSLCDQFLAAKADDYTI